MLTSGEIIKSNTGKHIRIENVIGEGGQGMAYMGRELEGGEKVVVKVFSNRFDRASTIERIQFLVANRFDKVCPVFKSPIDSIITNSWVGHYSSYAMGKTLEDIFANSTFSFLEGLIIAVALAHSIDILHEQFDIAHGDIQANNIFINTGNKLNLFLIDFDNFKEQGISIPPCIGHNLYMAPELRQALQNGQSAIPNIFTDRYSLGIVIHEIILLRHIAAGVDNQENEFTEAMCSGRWIDDPAGGIRADESCGGYPSIVLNSDLMRLVRKSVSLDPDERPPASEWRYFLCRALNNVFLCDKCNFPSLIEVSKNACPFCKEPYPYLKLITTRGIEVILDSASTVVGRDTLRGSNEMSARHAIFHRVGPETNIEPLGRNGTFKWTGKEWIRLQDHETSPLESGDLLRFADMEIKVVLAT